MARDVDEPALARLRDDCGDDFPIVLSALSSDVRFRIGRIAHALAVGDAPRANHEAHALRGVADTFALPRLAELARALEVQCARRDLVEARALSRRLPAIARTSVEALLRRVR